MTTAEFKAWFEGFSEVIEGQPTPAQWERIKKRVSEIDGSPISYPVYVDRWSPYNPPWLVWNGPVTVWNGPVGGANAETAAPDRLLCTAVSYGMMADAGRKDLSDIQ